MDERTLEYMRKSCFADGKKVMQLRVLTEIDKTFNDIGRTNSSCLLEDLRKRIVELEKEKVKDMMKDERTLKEKVAERKAFKHNGMSYFPTSRGFVSFKTRKDKGEL